MFLVAQGLAGRHHYAVARVHPHRVDVLHVADGDAVVGAVAHHLVLELLPAEEAALDQHLVDGGGGDAPGDDLLELLPGVRDAAAGTAQRVGGADHERQAQPVGHAVGLLDAGDDFALRHRFADLVQELLEQVTVLGLPYRLDGRAEQAYAVLVEHAGVGQGDGEVQPGLAAQRRQEAVRAFAGDDALDDGDGEGLDVDNVGDALVGHDGGGVGVDEHRLHSLFPQRTAGLGSGVVEFGGLADDDRPGADDQHLLGLVGHAKPTSRTSKR